MNRSGKAFLNVAFLLGAASQFDARSVIGEIRDLETAEIAIRAALTGHLVFSTLHTNDAPSTITRLKDMGIPTFLLTATIEAILAQRLVRRLHTCKAEDELPEEAMIEAGFVKKQLKDLVIYKPKGCSKCNGGYKGRIGVFEAMPITETIARIILEEGNALDITKQAREEGIHSLRRAALNKVSEGITGLMEINRVTKD